MAINWVAKMILVAKAAEICLKINQVVKRVWSTERVMWNLKKDKIMSSWKVKILIEASGSKRKKKRVTKIYKWNRNILRYKSEMLPIIMWKMETIKTQTWWNINSLIKRTQNYKLTKLESILSMIWFFLKVGKIYWKGGTKRKMWRKKNKM